MKRAHLIYPRSLLILGVLALLPLPVGADDAKKPAPSVTENSKPVTAAVTLPVYKPPLRGAPGGRISGGTRGADAALLRSALNPDSLSESGQWQQPSLPPAKTVVPTDFSGR
jgi:hypothetical protein